MARDSRTNRPRTGAESRASASAGGSSRPSSGRSRGCFHRAPSATKETTRAAPAPTSRRVNGSGRSSREPTPWATSPLTARVGVTTSPDSDLEQPQLGVVGLHVVGAGLLAGEGDGERLARGQLLLDVEAVD